MALVNEHFLKLSDKYLFAEVAKRVNAFKVAHPQAQLIDLGSSDVFQSLCPAVIEAMHKAVDQMALPEAYDDNGAEQGYNFLREAIVRNEYLPRGVHIEPSEIFINDGEKSDIANIQELVGLDNTIAVTDPAFPVYLDSNVMVGRACTVSGSPCSDVQYIRCTRENGFKPQLPSAPVDIIYLCNPNNPTGSLLTRDELRKWVNYALKNDALIFYDAAYEPYIQDADVPHTIYEIKGARHVAVEFRSYTRTAGLMSVRCGYTVVPMALTAAMTATKDRIGMNRLWLRRQNTKSNGTSYVSQRAAEVLYSEEGRRQVKEKIDYYMANARIMRERLLAAGHRLTGGDNVPFLWLATPEGTSSWDYFRHILYNAHVVCTPGIGFGPSGEGYVRLVAFASREDCEAAVESILRS